MLEAAMRPVLADATAATKFSTPGPGGPDLFQRTAAREGFSKKAFDELRGACVSHGGHLTATLLDLENEIDNGLPDVDFIEAKARRLRDEAFAVIQRANAMLAEMEAEPPIPTPPKRSWLPWRARA